MKRILLAYFPVVKLSLTSTKGEHLLINFKGRVKSKTGSTPLVKIMLGLRREPEDGPKFLLSNLNLLKLFVGYLSNRRAPDS